MSEENLSEEEKALREQGLATGRPDLLDRYQQHLRNHPPTIQGQEHE